MSTSDENPQARTSPAPASGGWAPVRDDEAVLVEALNKSGVIWLVTQTSTHALWHASKGPVTYVITGPGEQSLPPLPERLHLCIPSKSTGAALLRVPAAAHPVSVDDELWEEAAGLLAGTRLNAPYLPTELVEHWRSESTIYQITPLGAPRVQWNSSKADAPRMEQPVRASDAPGAAVVTALPRHLGKRAGRARKAR